jgi:hypothetical protein
MSDPEESQTWLLLLHQLPPKPAYFRVKTWRRLQGLGAVAVKNSVYVLPANDEAREDFQWLLREIVDGGGEACICEARMIDGLTDAEVRALFDVARDADYRELADELRAVKGGMIDKAPSSAEQRSELEGQVRRLRKRFTEVTAIDFFGANGRETVDGLLSALEARLNEPAISSEDADLPTERQASLTGKVWVTRQGIHVDRMASAWLIRRFIDPAARFKFVPGKGYRPQPGEIRFDMFEAEFTHEGDRCTFEVLLSRAGIEDAALAQIGEIVHDIDIKDGKFDRLEAPGIAQLVAGIAMANDDDMARLERGAAVFDDLLEYFRRKRRPARRDVSKD